MTRTDKLAAAAHLLIARLHPSHLGATKLNKILWFADCESYRRHGRSLTGESHYVRKPNGPCVKRLEEVLSSLKADSVITETLAHTYIGHPRREFAALIEPNLAAFSTEEVDILLTVAYELRAMTAAEASELSHDALWEETPSFGEMAVAAGAVKVAPLKPEEMDWARAAFN